MLGMSVRKTMCSKSVEKYGACTLIFLILFEHVTLAPCAFYMEVSPGTGTLGMAKAGLRSKFSTHCPTCMYKSRYIYNCTLIYVGSLYLWHDSMLV